MSCDFTEQVSLLIDGELPADQATRVERHVATCAECKEARTDFLNLRREIADYHRALDPQAQERALAEILSGRSRGAASTPVKTIVPGWRERLAASFGVPSFGVAMATACALLLIAGLVSVIIYRSSHREPVVANAPRKEQTPRQILPTPETSPVKQRAEQQEQRAAGPIPDERKNLNRGPVIQTANNRPRERRTPAPRLQQNESVPNLVAVNASERNLMTSARVSSADAETLTARHVEQLSLLLRAFRNARPGDNPDLSHETRRARQLLYQNIMLRREATDSGNVQVATLLDSIEPILIDIANLPERSSAQQVQAINQRIERKNLVPLLQVNSTELARAFD